MRESDFADQQGSPHVPDIENPTIENDMISGAPFCDLRLLEAICSRLCHDVINPISAVNNGIELLREQPQDAEINALIKENAEAAQMRLKLFRAAFGRSGIASSDDGFSLIKGLLHENLPIKNITLEWQDDHPLSQSRVPAILGKLVLNLVLAAVEELPRGGSLKMVDQEIEIGKRTFTITACDLHGAPNQNFPEYFRTQRFIQSTDTTDSKHAHALLALALSRHIGAAIDIQDPPYPQISAALRLHAPIKPLL